MATQHGTTRHGLPQHEGAEHRGGDSAELLTSASAAEPAHRGGRGRTVAVAGAAALLVLVAGGVYLGQRGDDSVTVTDRATGRSAGPGAVQPDPGTGLHVTVTGPTSVRLGQAATYTVTWTDDDGTYVGSTQDWGDTGDGGTKQGRCTSTVAMPGSGSFTATHTWAKAGTYPVRLTVTTQACTTGAPVAEDASATTTVVVAAG